MPQKHKALKAICFGEILWDNLPSGRLAGGAPMKVAYHLRKLGIDAKMISGIGRDSAGEDLKNFAESMALPTQLLQINHMQSTSEVIGTLKANHEMTYDIVFPTAWDFIEWQTSFDQLIASADVFIFGSLAARNEISRNTLMRLLDNAPYKVFDVNLRAPHYSKELISVLLSKADVVKLNENEIVILGNWFTADKAEEDIVSTLLKQFNLAEILVTKGAQGGTYYSTEQILNYTAAKVKVVDTVGSGDSFLAAFLSKKLAGDDMQDCLNFASKIAGFVTSQKGACPSYDIAKLSF